MVTVFLAALSGLRHISIGADTWTYYAYGFNKASQKSLGEIIENNSFLNNEDGEIGYALFEKVMSLICNNYQVYLIVIAIIFMVSLGYFIYKNSIDCYISYIVFFTNFFLFFGVTGLRQTLAQAIFLGFGYNCIKRRKLLKFLLVVVVAISFHKSAIIFLPFYFIYNMKINYKNLIIYACSYMLIFTNRWSVLMYLNKILGYGQTYTEQVEGAGTTTFSLLLILIAFIGVWFSSQKYFTQQQTISNVNAIMVAAMCIPFTFIDPNLMRALYYYSIFLVLLIPEIIYKFKIRDRRIVKMIVVCLLIYLFLRRYPIYRFFWE